MRASSIEIAEMLVAESALALTLGTNLFVGREPLNPANCVTIFDTYGQAPQVGLTTQGYEFPTIQIRVRNISYVEGWNMIESIKLKLHGIGGITWDETFYASIYCAFGPGLLDWDDNSRARFIINFSIQRRDAD